MEEIKKMSHEKFKKEVDDAVKSKAFEDLINMKNSHSKVKHIQYEKFQMQGYLKPCSLTNFEAKFAFHARSRMLRVKKNYGQKVCCPVCKIDGVEDTQSHLLNCGALVSENILTTKLPDYDNLFSKNLEEQINIVRILKQNFGARKRFLDKENSKS